MIYGHQCPLTECLADLLCISQNLGLCVFPWDLLLDQPLCVYNVNVIKPGVHFLL